MLVFLIFLISPLLSQPLSGCTEPNALNYNPNATIDDCSCFYDDYYYDVFYPIPTDVATVFPDSLPALEPGDQIGIFDLNGLLSYHNCDSLYGEILVGAGEWHCDELIVHGVGSIDNCEFGGDQMPGGVDGHPVHIRVYRGSEDQVYYALPEYEDFWPNDEEGYFGQWIFPNFVTSLTLFPEDESLIGCTDPIALNHSPVAIFDDSSCEYPLPGDFDLSGVVDVLDILILVNYILYLEPGDFEMYAGDLNEDNILDISDILLMVSIIMSN